MLKYTHHFELKLNDSHIKPYLLYKSCLVSTSTGGQDFLFEKVMHLRKLAITIEAY